MTDNEHTHCRNNIEEFSDLMRTVYERGQGEHGGSLWLKPVTHEIVGEVVDLAHYVMTKRQQEGMIRTLVEAALKSDCSMMKDAALRRVLELLHPDE